MKNKPVFLSALIGATLLAPTLHYFRKHPEDPRVHRSENAHENRAPALPDSAPAAIRSTPENLAGSDDATDPSPPTILAEKRNHLSGIPAELLKEARKTAEEMTANMDGYKSGMSDACYHNHSLNSGNPAKKLSLRLGLDQATAQKVDSILTSALAEQIKQRLDAEQARMDRETRLLSEDRGSYPTPQRDRLLCHMFLSGTPRPPLKRLLRPTAMEAFCF